MAIIEIKVITIENNYLIIVTCSLWNMEFCSANRKLVLTLYNQLATRPDFTRVQCL